MLYLEKVHLPTSQSEVDLITVLGVKLLPVATLLEPAVGLEVLKWRVIISD